MKSIISTEGRTFIYPWTESVTEDWSPESGLYELRDLEPGELAEWLWVPGAYVQISAFRELLAHGNIRKAAGFLQSLVAQHPEVEEQIRVQYKGFEMLFDNPVENFPGSFSDMDRSKIEVIQ